MNEFIIRLKDLLRPHVSRLRERAVVPSWEQSFRVLARYGFRPNTVFDVGVAYGNYGLHRTFPDVHYHLIDPSPEAPATPRDPPPLRLADRRHRTAVAAQDRCAGRPLSHPD